jgi:nicotinamidase-related amidase
VVLVTVDGSPPGRTEVVRHRPPSSPDWTELVPGLEQHTSDLRITKRSPGAFTHTDLEDTLREGGVTQVVITGIATGGGVDATARQAYELGFNVTLPADAMTDGSLDRHDHTVTRVFPRLGETGTTAEILDLLERLR